MWKYTGDHRPEFALEPGPAQESVWDYPRPPRLDPESRRVVVCAGATIIAETVAAVRVLETASPPTVYVPPDDVDQSLLVPVAGSSYCEWKGEAVYWSVSVRLPGRELERVAWSYPTPLKGFREIAEYVSFYPAHLECRVGGIRVQPQPGGFYGGWVTPEIIGPYKGEPGTAGW